MIGEDVELRIVKVHGSGDRVILDQSDFDSLYPLEQARHLLPGQIQYLPGTHRLLFNIQVVVDGPTRLRKDDVLAIDLDVGNLERVLPPGRGGNFHASPDGSSLAIIQPTSIGIADVDDADSYLELLTYPAVDTYSGNQYYPEPVWSSDSSSFAVALPSPDPLVPDPTTAVWVFYTDGSAPVQTASIRGQTYFPQAFGAPVISPDLSRIAFLRPGREQNEEHLIISDEDDGDELRYTTGDLRWIGWAPNSSVFAYSLGPSHLEVGRIGEPPIPIGPGSQFRWINDQQYLYLTGTDDNWHLLRGIPGGRAERITQLSGTDVVYDFILCSPSTK
jgi:hypothetical protein